MKFNYFIKTTLLLLCLLGGVNSAWADDLLMVSWNNAPTCTNDNTDCSTTGSAKNLATWADGTIVKIMNGNKDVSNGSNITIGGTSYKTIKVSNGAQNKLTMPSGKFAYAVDFYSYVNISATDAGTVGSYYWKEVNGISYTTPSLTCYSDGDLTNPDKASFSLGGVSSFTFNNAGKQLCYVLAISTTPITTQPANATYGQNETPSALTIEASSSAGTLTYQWYSCTDVDKTNATAISGATSASYDGFSTATVGTSYYYCVVTDNNGSFSSEVAAITIVEASALHTVTFSIGSATGVSGILPAAVQASSVIIPTNTMLYKTDYTLTGWTDGTSIYEAGDTYAPTADVTLTAVFTANTETLSEFRRDKVVTWYFGKGNGAADYNGSAAANVQQVKIKNTTVDLGIKMTGGSNEGRNDEWMNNQSKYVYVPVVKDAVVKAKVYYTYNATFNGVEIVYDADTHGTQGNVIFTYTYTGNDPAEIAVNVGNQFLSYIEVTYPGTGNAWDNFEDFSAIINNQTGTLLTSGEMAAQGNAVNFGVIVNEGVTERVAADNEDAIAVISGKYHSDHGCTNVKVVVPVPGAVKIGVGQCSYSSKNIVVKDGTNTTIVTKTPATACWKSNRSNVTYLYYSGDATTLTISGMDYCPFISVALAPFYTISGTIAGGNIDGKKVVFTSELTEQAFEATVASNAFTLNVPADTYTVTLSDGEYVIGSPTSVTVTGADAVTINLISATPQTVSGVITNAPSEAFTLTFTGANNTETVNCAAGAASFTASLKPDTYTMSSNVGTLSALSAENFTVVNAAVTHNIYFPEAAVPNATSANITVDNTLAAASANNYKTVTDALAAAKAGNISNPVITLTSGQTYKEQVIVDRANVTLKTSGTEKATITWYYGIGYTYYSLNSSGYYDKDRANTRNSINMNDPGRWGATVLVKSTGSGFYAENIIFENSFNQRYTTEEVADGVIPNGVQSINYDRTLASGDAGYKAADSKDVTERAAALAFENSPTGCELYNCELIGSQDTYYTSGKIYIKDCSITGNTDYIFGGGDVVFDNCDLVIGGYSDSEAGAHITANNPTQGEYYIFRDCTVKSAGRAYYAADLGRDWGGTKAGVYFFNLKNEIGNKLSYKWSDMGGAVSDGTANLHIYDFDPTVNTNYNTTGSTGANVNGVLSDANAKTFYTGVVTRLGFTPKHIYENMVFDENSVYNPIHIAAYNGGTGSVVLNRTINAGNWSTIVLPFSISATALETALGTTVTLASYTNFENNTLYFTSADAITANEPCMIKVANAVSGEKTISGVTIVESSDPYVDQSGVRFQGVFSSTKMNAGDYFVSGNKLYKATENTNNIKPFRAYFTNVPNTNNARLSFFDDETSGIESVQDSESIGHSYYNLNGQRIAQPAKGLYIVNGKKVIIK